MERENRNLKVLVIILCIIVLALGSYFVYDKILSNNTITNDSINDTLNDSVNDVDNELSNDEKIGLELYKYFVGNGTGPFKWEDGKVTNYDEVVSKMTADYLNSFKNKDHGFSIPYYEEGIWKSDGSYGTTYNSKFKDIKVTMVNSTHIHYEITYTYTTLGGNDSKVYTGTNNFIVEPNGDNNYKVHSFDLIYGMQF